MTEKLRYGIVRRLNALIAEMSRPQPLGRRVRGLLGGSDVWPESVRREWLALLLELRERVASGGSSFEAEARHLERRLDHDGISGGRWAEEIRAVQHGLFDLSGLERRP